MPVADCLLLCFADVAAIATVDERRAFNSARRSSSSLLFRYDQVAGRYLRVLLRVITYNPSASSDPAAC
jgi:hypothetical protein